jgi:hypothetical protein
MDFHKHFLSGALLLALAGCATENRMVPDQISGIYPRLAYYNNEGECGTGAVVPWADRLWVITYGPHLPMGSSDKLYEITPDYQQITRPESTGGTPANRLIHDESAQLFIGPYAIDTLGRVRVIPYSQMPGRLTGNARHLTEPARKIYYGTMEEGFYEVDVNTLEVKELYEDGNYKKRKASDTDAGPVNDLLPGVHGKGLYSGQGVMVFSNNGEGTQEALYKFDVPAGVLAEWDGKDWKVVRRNQFTEVTGPGGIHGNAHPETDPIWAVGWDYKSLLLGVRDARDGWTFYRLPKASHSYDGAHGWNTEWPRIRNVGTDEAPEYVMTMHGMFFHFPGGFTKSASAGLRPASAYLKVIGDFTRWQDRLVFGCDDSANKEFLNKRKAKGGIEGPGQSNSNLWFADPTLIDHLGPATVEGAVWAKEDIPAGTYSEPFIFAGWPKRFAWLKNDSNADVTYTFEVDKQGDDTWTPAAEVTVPAGGSTSYSFSTTDEGEWIRVKTDKDTRGTVSFSYTAKDARDTRPDGIFKGLADIHSAASTGGLLYGLGGNRRSLGVLANQTDKDGLTATGYYEIGETLELKRADNDSIASFIQEKFAIPSEVIDIDEASVLVIDDSGRRWRLPLGDEAYKAPTEQARLRICREVATERDLFSCMGTFYELPAENADGYAKIRPVASHPFRINDYASYRGMLVMTGIDAKAAKGNEHVLISEDGKAAVWVGVIDDLWKLGKPVGVGGPWKDTDVKAGEPSDPYLIAFYDQKELTLSHQSDKAVRFTLEADPTGNGDWMTVDTYEVEPGKSFQTTLPADFQARWVRLVTDADAKVTARFIYK